MHEHQWENTSNCVHNNLYKYFLFQQAQRTALALASYRGHSQVVSTLLAAGANTDIQDTVYHSYSVWKDMYCNFTPLYWLRIDIVLTTSVLHSTSYSELSILMMTGETIGSKGHKVLPNLSKVLYKHLDCLVSVGGGDEKTTLWQSDTKKHMKSHFISQTHSSIILTLMHCIFILIY